MVEDHLVPAHHREDAIAGGEFLPRRPFGFAIFAVALELGRHRISSFRYRFRPATYATGEGDDTMAERPAGYVRRPAARGLAFRSEEHTSELQSLMRIS